MVKAGHVHQGDGLDSHESGRKPSKSLISCRSARNRRAKTGREAVEAVGVVLYTSRAKEPLPCAAMPTSGPIRASKAALGRRVRLNAHGCMS